MIAKLNKAKKSENYRKEGKRQRLRISEFAAILISVCWHYYIPITTIYLSFFLLKTLTYLYLTTGIRIRCENGPLSLSLGGLISILIFIKHFLSTLKISKTFVFFLRTSSEYLKQYRQISIFKTDPWKRTFIQYPYL